MQCPQHWLVPVIVSSFLVLVPDRSALAQGGAGLVERTPRAPELIETDERTQRAVLRSDDGMPYVVRVGETDAVSGLALQRVGVSTVIFEGQASGPGAGLRLRIETDGRQSRATWSSELPPAELMRTTPVWMLLAPLDGVTESPEDDQ